MRNIIAFTLAALAGCANAPQLQKDAPAAANAHLAHAKPAAMPTDLDSHGFAALEAMTFDCPKAALNAAAREAGKVPSQGTYQFSYFNIVNDAHHSTYEVRFRSNHLDEPELRYCVSLYCQQGWDPRTTQVDVRRMSDQAAGSDTQRQNACGGSAGSRKKPPQQP
jgi:hypothetical protein